MNLVFVKNLQKGCSHVTAAAFIFIYNQIFLVLYPLYPLHN